MTTVEEIDKYLKRIFAVNKKAQARRRKDKPREVKVGPNKYHLVGVSGKVYMMYGEKLKQAALRMKATAYL